MNNPNNLQLRQVRADDTKVPSHQDGSGQDSEQFDGENCGPSMEGFISSFSLLIFCSAQGFLQNKGVDLTCF